MSEPTSNIISQGAQILLPFEAGDASITFPSRWKLAEMMENIIDDALAKGGANDRA